ncbi:MAG TPA: hypothetical protein VKE94_00675 [Gemmataceae bacterium]|nr:hypothetical protein [Gemmataceae bacterium]
MTRVAQRADFTVTFETLKAILAEYAPKLTVVRDEPGDYYLDAGYSEKWKKTICFGWVKTCKNYVSFYLMAVYGCPALLEGTSDELKKRMQGKSCFNFKTVTPAQLKELKALTKRGFEAYKRQGWV